MAEPTVRVRFKARAIVAGDRTVNAGDVARIPLSHFTADLHEALEAPQDSGVDLVTVRFKQHTALGGQVAKKGSVHRIFRRDLHPDLHDEVPSDTPLDTPVHVDDLGD